jgi:hypothetical protein
MNIKIVLLALVVLLAGCEAAGPQNRAFQAFDLALGGISPKMLEKNVTASVSFDEAHPLKTHRITRIDFFGQGVDKDSVEYNYRMVPVNFGHFNNFGIGRVNNGYGTLVFKTAAMVPDHLPLLKAGDLIELRQTVQYNSMKDFVAKQEGNTVLRILCRKADPDFLKCQDSVPHHSPKVVGGYTDRPYLKSLKEYGFTFTQAYDKQGNAFRPFPADVAAVK